LPRISYPEEIEQRIRAFFETLNEKDRRGYAGIEAENSIMQGGYDVNADILKVGHHGSRTASGASFISAVSPDVSIIEVGADNTYGHPHTETLNRLQRASKVYRTDMDGTITVTTDGSSYSISTEKTEPVQGAYSSTSSTTTSKTESSTTPKTESSTTTSKTEPTANINPSSTDSTVYVSDLNLKDDWVKVTNKDSSPVSLGGWKIKDEESKHTYIFPSYTLDSGATVTVYTGKGTNSATDLYWGSGSPIWNNDGDTAYLYDNNGKLVSTLER